MQIFTTNSDHYDGIANLYQALYPENPTSASEIAAGDKRRDPKFRFQRWIAVIEKQVVGMGYYTQSNWFAHPQKFILWIGVLPDHQRRGIGSGLYETILHGLQSYDPIAVRATAGEDFIQSRQFLEKRGFREVIRDIRSELDVRSFDLSRFSGLEDHFRDEGIEIKTLAELEGDPERNRKLYDLDWEISLTVPGDLAAGIGRRGFDQYVEYAITGPSVLPEGFFVAVKGGEYIGLSHVRTIEKGVSLYQGLTGVRPQYRGQGIGLAMKIRVIEFAKAGGYSLIRAENDAKNSPMLAMNGKLGYEQKFDIITFEKQFQT